MNYKDFKNIHKGQKIIVSGCGCSAPLLTNPQDYITIGVNDISRLYSPNYLVVLNDKSSFSIERWMWIEKTQSPYILTHIKTLDVPEEKKVILQLGQYGGYDLNKDAVDYTSNSPYLACIVASYMSPVKIGLLGVDFTMNHFFEQSGPHSLSRRINQINQEYANLENALKLKGIELVNLSQESNIDIRKESLNDF